MTEPGTLNFSFIRDSEANGMTTDYTFTIESSVPLVVGDVFKLVTPSQLKPTLPRNSLNIDPAKLSRCIGIEAEVSCTASLTEASVTLLKITDPKQFKVKVTNMQNPPSMQISDSFSGLKMLSAEEFLVSKMPDDAKPITILNTEAGTIQDFDLIQESLVENEANAYQIEFTPTNLLPETAVIKVIYPE